MTDVGERRDFDPDTFLAQPLVARVATAGPTVRPIWFLWEDGSFWWLTGSWSVLGRRLRDDPRVALVVDTCELSTGTVLQVRATGDAAVVPFDAQRARRKLRRYLGPDEQGWDRDRFDIDAMQRDPSAALVRLVPSRMETLDLSYEPAIDPSD